MKDRDLMKLLDEQCIGHRNGKVTYQDLNATVNLARAILKRAIQAKQEEHTRKKSLKKSETYWEDDQFEDKRD